MEKNKATSDNQSSNRPKRLIKNDKKLNIENGTIIGKYDIVFKYKEKRSIKNNKKKIKIKIIFTNYYTFYSFYFGSNFFNCNFTQKKIISSKN